MLFVLPFIVMAITFVGYYFSIPEEGQQVKRCIDFSFLACLDKFWLSVLGGGVVLGIAYLIFFINERFKLLHQTTTLPSLIYVLLIFGSMAVLDNLLVAVLIVILAISRLQLAINDIKSNHTLFDFGALVVLAVAIYPKFVMLVAWAICTVFFSGRTTLKDISALLLGLVTPVLLLAFYYFWTDRLVQLPGYFVADLWSGEYASPLQGLELARIGILLFLLLVALVNFSLHYSILAVSHRRGIFSFISMLGFFLATLFFIPVHHSEFMYILALPLSFIYAFFFLFHRTVIFGNLMFLLLLTACCLGYLS